MAYTPDDRNKLRNEFAHYLIAPDFASELGGDQTEPDRRRGFGNQPGTFGARATGRQGTRRPAIIELNADYPSGLENARADVLQRLPNPGMPATRKPSRHYVFADISLADAERILEPVEQADGKRVSPVAKIWRDEELKPLINRSVRTVKADACFTAFGADGKGIVVAIVDSGVDADHPHFQKNGNLTLPLGLEHQDFAGSGSPTHDGYGHGTHVAGIVAGTTTSETAGDVVRVFEERDTTGNVATQAAPLEVGTVLRGVAPKATILSLKVLNDAGRGTASNVIAALEYVEETNDFGRRIKIHCVNLSLGYPFDAQWYAAGQSPLCAVVNRISRSGVVVVAAAGNDGSAMIQPDGSTKFARIGLGQSINDPGNADEAITVGATHGEAPHRYGISFFSSRGPTADGRFKPDLVAPGERILSCAATSSPALCKDLGSARAAVKPGVAYFREESGTSMAAPHVAGAVAALLSVRSEMIGRSEDMKALLVSTCTDLKRKADFQGAGLLDMMRAIQAV